MKHALGWVIVLGLALPACSHGGNAGGCGPAAPTLATVPPTAMAFPAPPGLSVIGVEHKEPVTEIIAAVDADVGQVFQGYQRALAGAGYLVNNPTQGSDFAQLGFRVPALAA